jgi:arylsulfatase A-like enzyme
MNAAKRLAVLAAWCGLVTGLAELALRAVQHFILHRFIYVGRQVVWMTPLADVLLCAAVALLLGLLALGWRRAASLRIAGGVLAFVSAMGVLSMQPWVAWWGNALLALGFAMQVSRLAEPRADAVLRWMARTVPVLAGVVALMVAAQAVLDARTARRAQAASRPPTPGTPNVLVVVWDVVRARSLSHYGYGRATTPRLAAFAAQGVTFDRAMAPSPYTLATHASLFTGRWPHQLTATWEVPLDGATPTLAEAMAARGHRTGAFSANHIMLTWEHGLLRGFAHAEDYVFSAGELARSAALLKWLLSVDALRPLIGWYDVPGRRDAADIRRQFAAWLDVEPGRPFFAFLNLYDAHGPYLPPAPFDTLFVPHGGDAGARARARRLAIARTRDLPPADRTVHRGLYDGAIAELDTELDSLLAVLDVRGVRQNTLVVLLSDHGEAFGDHGVYEHGNSAYPEEVHVPLVVVQPGRVPAGRRVSAVVSVRDVAATIGDLIGAADWPLPGRPLTRLWRDTAAANAGDTVLTEVEYLRSGGQPGAPSRRGDVRSIIAWPHQLIATVDSLELYDLAADPEAQRDLAALPERRALRDALAAALVRWRQDAVPAKAWPARTAPR